MFVSRCGVRLRTRFNITLYVVDHFFNGFHRINRGAFFQVELRHQHGVRLITIIPVRYAFARLVPINVIFCFQVAWKYAALAMPAPRALIPWKLSQNRHHRLSGELPGCVATL